MLAVSELAEAMEGARKGLKDDKLPDCEMLEVELADCAIRVFDLAGALGYNNFGGTLARKMQFNATRADHKVENRAAEGGKKFLWIAKKNALLPKTTYCRNLGRLRRWLI